MYCWYCPLAKMSVHLKNWEQSEGWGKYPAPSHVNSAAAELRKRQRRAVVRLRAPMATSRCFDGPRLTECPPLGPGPT